MSDTTFAKCKVDGVKWPEGYQHTDSVLPEYFKETLWFY